MWLIVEQLRLSGGVPAILSYYGSNNLIVRVTTCHRFFDFTLNSNCEFKLPLDPSIVASSERGGLLARSDMALHNQDWTENVIGKVSEWIDLDCSEINTRCIRF